MILASMRADRIEESAESIATPKFSSDWELTAAHTMQTKVHNRPIADAEPHRHSSTCPKPNRRCRRKTPHLCQQRKSGSP